MTVIRPARRGWHGFAGHRVTASVVEVSVTRDE